jgi:hypothetical protein
MLNSPPPSLAPEPAKIPLTIGFANLSGDDLDPIASEDSAALSPLFARSRVVPAHNIPSADILFIYAHLNDDGTLVVPTMRYGIQQVAQITNAAVVVLASPNPAPSVQKAAALPDPSRANIVFTFDRKGSGFTQFFRQLFEKMRDGEPMLTAWVALEPQIPVANLSTAPRTILLAGRGNIAFPGALTSQSTATSAAPGSAVNIARETTDESRKGDPFRGAKSGAKEVVPRLMQLLNDERGVPAETLLAAIGSLAGYACQAAVRAEYVDGKGMPESAVLHLAKVSAGDPRKFYFGDLLNKPLAESPNSIWNLAAGAAHQMGAKEAIDLLEIFRHVAGSVGGATFGILRVPDRHRPRDTPANLLKRLWPVLFPVAQRSCRVPSEWPILFGLAVQDVMLRIKPEILDPKLALAIVMESAIAMSKVDFGAL